jgi:hypothetical protein
MSLSLTGSIFSNLEQRLFWGLCTLCVIFMGLYVYFLSASVYNVVLRKEMSLEMSTVNTRISELESAFLQKNNDITMSMAEGMGFSPIDDSYKTYVVRDHQTNLTLNR